MRYRHILYAFLFSFLFGGLFALAGQEVSDTILVTIQGNVTDVVLTAEYVTPPRVGDSIPFRAVVTDEDGDPITALISFYSEDPTALRLEMITDSTVAVNEGLALGIALRKATVRVWVVVEPIGEMRMASFRDGVFNWSGQDEMVLTWIPSPGDSTWVPPGADTANNAEGYWVHDRIPGPGEPLQYCAYLTRGTDFVGQNPLPPACPIVFTQAPLPAPLSRMARRPITGSEFRRLSRGLRVNPT